MKHEALTVSTDQQRLLDGAVEAGEFESRSEAIRTILADYFRTDLDRTAAMVATNEDVLFQPTVEVLALDPEAFAERVRKIDEGAVPDRLNVHLDQESPEEALSSVLETIEAEVTDVARDAAEEDTS